jgi:DNA-binding Lrp family transcriptional regulator
MAREIRAVVSEGGIGGLKAVLTSPLLFSTLESEKSSNPSEDAAVRALKESNAILRALGDESSRRILVSAIASGKTVEEISATQNLPLSTCYRRVNKLVAAGLMVLEKSVVTPAGKRYGVYRTTFSGVSIRLDENGAIVVDLAPNLDTLEKLHGRWLSENFTMWGRDKPLSRVAAAAHNLMEQTNNLFG